MRLSLRWLLAGLIVVFLVGCGGGVNYAVKPTPLQQGKSTYQLGNFKLDLDDSSKDPSNFEYLNQEGLANSFKNKITSQLKEQNIYGDEYTIDVDMFYSRVFNIGGNKLNKPQFVYTVSILDKEGKLLASYTIPKSTTKYTYFREIAVNMQIGTFNRGPENEPEDIELISKTLVRDIKEIGK
jgi:hypothetical protein